MHVRFAAISLVAGLVMAGCGATASPTPAVTPGAAPTPAVTPGETAVRSLSPTISGRPPNDDPPGITIAALPFTDSTDTTQAEIHAMEPSSTCAGSGAKSVWYNFTAKVGSTLVADTLGSEYDTVIDVYQGTLTNNLLDPGFETLKAIACNDNSGDSLQSQVVFAAAAGQSYVMRVMSALNSNGGALTFHLFAA